MAMGHAASAGPFYGDQNRASVDPVVPVKLFLVAAEDHDADHSRSVRPLAAEPAATATDSVRAAAPPAVSRGQR